MLASGFIGKMEFDLIPPKLSTQSIQIEYYLVLNHKRQLLLNNLLGKTIIIKFSGKLRCTHCQKFIKKSYQQGHCYLCAIKLAKCDLCIVNPHTCHYHLGTCREPGWGEKNCFIPYIVYLANSSGVKIGVSRESNLLNRWVDQGAIQGLAIIKTSSRRQAGLIEFALAKFIKDKTNWRKMLSFTIDKIDLAATANKLINNHTSELKAIIDRLPINSIQLIPEITSKNVITINYPIIRANVNNPPIVSLNKLIKPQLESIIQGQLVAIKGQYLLFNNGVLNLRNLTGSYMELGVFSEH